MRWINNLLLKSRVRRIICVRAAALKSQKEKQGKGERGTCCYKAIFHSPLRCALPFFLFLTYCTQFLARKLMCVLASNVKMHQSSSLFPLVKPKSSRWKKKMKKIEAPREKRKSAYIYILYYLLYCWCGSLNKHTRKYFFNAEPVAAHKIHSRLITWWCVIILFFFFLYNSKWLKSIIYIHQTHDIHRYITMGIYSKWINESLLRMLRWISRRSPCCGGIVGRCMFMAELTNCQASQWEMSVMVSDK